MNWDLNIQHYSIPELKQLLDLESKDLDVDLGTIKTKIQTIIDNTLKSNLEESFRQKTISFLNQIFTRFIDHYEQTAFKLKPTNVQQESGHMIQHQMDKPFLSSFPSQFFPGTINPLKKRTLKINLNIDTKFRENYFANPSTNFQFMLPTQFNNVMEMQLSSLELPITYYAVSKQYGNNFFAVSVNEIQELVEIPEGNYTMETIVDAVNAQLQLLGGDFANVVFQDNTGSGQTIVQMTTTNDSDTLELNFVLNRVLKPDQTPLPLKLGWMLGFRNGLYVGNINYISEGIIDTKGSKYLFLVVDDHNNNVNNGFYSAFNQSVLNNNILARISLQTPIYQTLGQNNLSLVTTPREYFGPVNLTNLHIQLLDEYGRVVNLNNMDYSFCLTLTTVYDI